MTSLKIISKSFKKLLSTRKDVEIPAFLGNLAGTVKADENSNVYVVLFNGEVVTVRNVRVPNVSRMPVVIGYDASDPTLLQVMRARNTFVNPIYPDVPEHSNATHQWPSPDTLWVRGEQILPGLAVPSALTVEFVGFVYYLSGFHLLQNQTIDLSGEVPASGANYVLVEVDSAGAVTFNAGSSVASREVLTPADIPTPTTNKMPLFAVKMYVGQTEISNSLLQSDIVDLRWANWSAGGGGGAWGSITGTLADQTDLQSALDGKQPVDADLSAIAALAPANDDVIQRKAGAWVNRTIAQLVTDIRTVIDSVYAPIAKGVTNGDTHDHAGGDGNPIAGIIVPYNNTANLYRHANPTATTRFNALINGTPTNVANSVVTFDTVTNGNVTSITPNATGQLAQMRMYNTTRGDYALIVSATGSQFTLDRNVRTLANPWADNDAVTNYQTTIGTGGVAYAELEIVNADLLGKSALYLEMSCRSTTAGELLSIHPYVAYASSKEQNATAHIGGGTPLTYTRTALITLTSNVIGIGWQGTAYTAIILKILGYLP